MQLENTFTVPMPVDQTWPVLLDVERVAPCMPGATLDSVDGDELLGRVKVKLGPIQITYNGKARFVEKDELARRVVIEASGKESKSAGTASAIVTMSLRERGCETDVHVLTEFTVTGKPAQFGRGAMQEVSAKLIDQFARRLSAELSSGQSLAESAPSDAPEVPAASERGAPHVRRTAVADAENIYPRATGGDPRPTDDSINLLAAAGMPIMKRLVPVAAAVALLLVVLFVWVL
jgi:carbon monoxide dehydrogenase subunit G